MLAIEQIEISIKHETLFSSSKIEVNKVFASDTITSDDEEPIVPIVIKNTSSVDISF